ncbi:hypothetical protein VPH35_086398 [Triticum aestivum]
MAFADAAARRLLHGAGGSVAKGIAADAVGMSFGLDGLWQLIVGLFASVAHLLVLPFEVLGHWLQAAVAHLVVLPFKALWHLLQPAASGVSFYFSSLVDALGSAAHALVVPLEALWHLLQSAVAGVRFCFDNLVVALGSTAHALVVLFEALWHLLQFVADGVSVCFENLVAVLDSAGHTLVVPFEAAWHWLQAAPARISFGFHALVVPSGLDGFWEHMRVIFAGLPAALASATHSLVLPLESLWRLDLAGFWPLVQRFMATAAGKAHELVPALEAFWRWLKDAAAVTLPYALAIAAVVCVIASVVCYYWQFLCNSAVQVAPTLGLVLCFCRDCLISIATWVVLCCTRVTMVGPGAAGVLISRPAFAANPRLYFKILRLAGPVVAAAVFSSSPIVAWVVGAVVDVLFQHLIIY